MLLLFSAAGAGWAQDAYVRGSLYRVISQADRSGKALGMTAGGKLQMAAPDAADVSQYWTLSELSGSWRIINPFSNRAVRTEGDRVEQGENNGSTRRSSGRRSRRRAVLSCSSRLTGPTWPPQ